MYVSLLPIFLVSLCCFPRFPLFDEGCFWKSLSWCFSVYWPLWPWPLTIHIYQLICVKKSQNALKTFTRSWGHCDVDFWPSTIESNQFIFKSFLHNLKEFTKDVLEMLGLQGKHFFCEVTATLIFDDQNVIGSTLSPKECLKKYPQGSLEESCSPDGWTTQKLSGLVKQVDPEAEFYTKIDKCL